MGDGREQLVTVEGVIFRAAQAAILDYFEGPAADFFRVLQGTGYGPIDERAHSAVETKLINAAQGGGVEVYGIEQFSRREGLIPPNHWRDGRLEYRPGGLALNGEGWTWTSLEMKRRDANRLWSDAPEPPRDLATVQHANFGRATISANPAASRDAGDEAMQDGWVRLCNGQRFVGRLWPDWDDRQRREVLITTLWSGTVRMRARFAAKPRHPDGRPMLPALERDDVLNTATPLPGIENLLINTDRRLLAWDITASRIVISPIYDDRRVWGGFSWEPLFPGGVSVATGRFLTVELDDIEFDGASARAYVGANLLPAEVASSGIEAESPESSFDAGNVIPFPYRTGVAGRPTSWHLIEVECRRRYQANERHPNRRTGIESPSEWARVLRAWLNDQHSGAAPVKEKTLTNHLARLLRELAQTP